MNKPDLNIPSEFASSGQKENFDLNKIENGFDSDTPEILSGDNLNKFIDDTYKGLNYTVEGVAALFKSAVMYDSQETYNINSLVFSVDNNSKVYLYRSLKNNNKNKSLTNDTYWSALPIDPSLFVLKNGDIMTGTLVTNWLINKGSIELQFNSNIIKGTNPEATSYRGISFNDDNDEATTWQARRLGLVECVVTNTGETRLILGSYKNEINNSNGSQIVVGYDANGNKYCTFPESKCVDGQVIKSVSVLTTVTSAGSYSLNFSNYLPNDGHAYNVLFAVEYACNSNSVGYAYINEYECPIARGKRGDSNNNGYFCNNFILPVTSSRKLTLVIRDAHFSAFELKACAYRRIGTNT